jgi:hypothetical protein
VYPTVLKLDSRTDGAFLHYASAVLTDINRTDGWIKAQSPLDQTTVEITKMTQRAKIVD